jgi:AcrR family transcriptional regulator
VRVTEETKQATRSRILEVTLGLLKSQGFDTTTTRDIAREAGVAVGTLFNYFATKEAIVMQLVADALDSAETAFERRRQPGAALEEDLFLHISTGLRQLRPLRSFLGPVLETGFSPARSTEPDGLADQLRTAHLDAVARILIGHGRHESASGLHLEMYWLLYYGLLSYWASDGSPKQEDTMAMLDQSMRMFVNWLGAGTSPAIASPGGQD